METHTFHQCVRVDFGTFHHRTYRPEGRVFRNPIDDTLQAGVSGRMDQVIEDVPFRMRSSRMPEKSQTMGMIRLAENTSLDSDPNTRLTHNLQLFSVLNS